MRKGNNKEIIKQDFEKKSSKLGKNIEQLEEEKMQLRLDSTSRS
ncbi:hypothetical protein Gotur_018921 [Gossypium turneri]